MTNTSSATRRSRNLASIAVLSCSLLLLAGCSSATSNASPGDQSSASARSGQGGQNGRGGGFGGNDPGRVSGEVAAVNGKTLQIQDGESQTAVTYSSSTTFLSRVTGKVSDISVGECVTVFSSASDENATSVTATSVTASAATKGDCESGFGGMGGGGGMSGGGRGARPSAAPSDAPSGAPSGMPNSGSRPRSGKVTAVKGDTITVAATQARSKDTTTLTVTTTADTTVTITKSAQASAAKVGMCATANGKADDTGAVAAQSITVYKAGDAGCGFRRGNR